MIRGRRQKVELPTIVRTYDDNLHCPDNLPNIIQEELKESLKITDALLIIGVVLSFLLYRSSLFNDRVGGGMRNVAHHWHVNSSQAKRAENDISEPLQGNESSPFV